VGAGQRAGCAVWLRRVDWTDQPGIRFHGLERRAVERFAVELHGVVELGPWPDADHEHDNVAAGCAPSARAGTPLYPHVLGVGALDPANPLRPHGQVERPAGGVGRPLTVGCRDAFVQAAGAPAAAAVRHDRRRIARLALRAAGLERKRLVAAFNGGFRLSVGAGGFESFGRLAAQLTDGLGSIVT
jgi:hypothetical protein